MGNKGPLKVLNGNKLILDDHGKNLDSFRISLESFRSFRGPLLHKPVTGQELFFAVSYSKLALDTHQDFLNYLAHSNQSATLATDQKRPFSHLRISYQSLQSTIDHSTNKGITTMVNGTMLNLSKRYKDNSKGHF